MASQVGDDVPGGEVCGTLGGGDTPGGGGMWHPRREMTLLVGRCVAPEAGMALLVREVCGTLGWGVWHPRRG